MPEPKELQFLAHVDIEAAAETSEGKKLPTFSMIAYTGGALDVMWSRPVAVDLAGMQLPAKSIPILYGHYGRVGHSTDIRIEGGQLMAAGVISCTADYASELVADAKNGFPWQASIGAKALTVEKVEAGATATANGKTIAGPAYIARTSVLREISFVELGADGDTSATVAAKAKENTMPDNEPQKDVQQAKPVAQEPIGVQAAQPAPKPSQNVDDILAEARAKRAKTAKIAELIAASADLGTDADVLAVIAQRAKDENWSIERTELEIMRAERPSSPGPWGGVNAKAPTTKVLEAALCLAAGVSDETLAKDRDYGDQVVSAAWKHRNLGLTGVLATAMAAKGVKVPPTGEGLFRACVAAGQGAYIQAGFSTADLTGLVGSSGNKILLDSFTSFETTYQTIAAQMDLNNFHAYTLYRMNESGGFETVGADGELKHNKLTEESYTNQLATKGCMLTLTRQMIVNDDMNAFRQLFALMGKNGAMAVESALYGQVMEASDVFYTSGRGNKTTSNPLCVEGLAAANAALLKMAGANGQPIFARGKFLLVPPELEFNARQLYTSAEVRELGTASKNKGIDNPYRGMFTPVTSPYLSLLTMTGYSATGWYLVADPSQVPAWTVAYLQGKRSPTVETADAAFNTLGMQFRCYFDFGVAQADYRGAVSNDA